MSGVYAHSFVDVSQSRICFPYLFKELCFIYIGAYKLLGGIVVPLLFFQLFEAWNRLYRMLDCIGIVCT